jgi:hypothetical protein
MTNKQSDVRRYQNPVVEDPKYVGENQSKNKFAREMGKAGNFEKEKPEEEMNFDPQIKKKNTEEHNKQVKGEQSKE